MELAKNIKLNVIIADDNVDDQHFIKSSLSEFSGISITSFYSGNELIDYLLQRKEYIDNRDSLPDIVIMDINMPKLTGFETFEELEKHEVLKNVRFIILSSSLTERDQINCNRFQLNCYVKPFTVDKFEALLLEIISDEGFDFNTEGDRTNFNAKRPPENENFT
jgi:CheY-like chemotaxis protein